MIEDDPAVHDIACGQSRDCGRQVGVADIGGLTLKALEARARFDPIMLDVVMPGGVSGVDLTRSVSVNHPDTAVRPTTGHAGARIDGAPADLP